MPVTPKIISTLLALAATSAASTTVLAAPPQKPTVAEAERFLSETEAKLNKLNNEQAQGAWVGSNFITDDTEAIASFFAERYLTASGEAAIGARRFNGLKLPADSARKLLLLQQTLVFANPKEREQYAALQAGLNGAYGKAKYCPKNADGSAGACMALGEMEKVLANSRDEAKLKEMWAGWHAQSPEYKGKYLDYIALSNKGAKQMGFVDTGAMWRSQYDMPADAFANEMERLWQQVKPLYDSLHTYSRYKLRETYGADVVPMEGPIPAHLYGNMWSQTWNNLYPILKPATGASNYSLTKVLEERKTDAKQMTKYAEGFYTSLGMQKLPASFWERSLFTKPRDRDVVCHASAWPINEKDDVRIKMCINPTAEDFTVIHHELGHVYYFLGYTGQPYLYRGGANDGFHEAIGDTIALSITPDYLQKIGLMDQAPDADADIGQLLERALGKVPMLPFAYMVDKWRWDVYAGKTKPADFDKSWWQLREQYMGMKRPVAMDAKGSGFDAGAKYHVAADVPYARYFLANMLQFQFHRALCREAGYTGPLHRCSIYGNAKAGAKLQQMLAMGASKPWPEELKAISGEERIDGGALLDYFAPLKTWLDAQNAAYAAAAKK
ncbi:M2 family metallopeptidase [Pseudoduganella danionis]|uniref:Peptidase M2 family protein n=1 Tax=Pseudoduganella danionis TaxID=1890295 RepID=A0ABW9SM18_9BURK|nr:M2 family metallopeptidase [Pseudoduganella danionis]MTW31779.1 peptidase M2 family protein [Pseudoduganella danionis]